MFNSKRGIFIVALALLGLLGMQGMWLYYAIEQENRNLNTSTRQAALQTLSTIEQKEDSRLIISSFDTLVPEMKIAGPMNKSAKVKVIVAEGRAQTIVRKNGKETITTSYTYSDNGVTHSEVKVISNEIPAHNDAAQKKAKAKLKNYEQLLKKIVYQSAPKKIEERVNFDEFTALLKTELSARGIDLVPESAIKDKDYKIIFKTKNYNSRIPGIELPIFTRDIVFQDYSLHLYFPSTLSYIFKKAIGVIAMSLCVTLLLIAIILLLYQKMLTERKLNQYKNDFINNLTHELKTPLATISLANSNIRANSGYTGQGNVKQYTQIIDEENKKLNTHIEKVFELSLLEKGRQVFNDQPNDIHELLEEAVKQNESAIHEKGAEVQLSLNASAHILNVDHFHFVNTLSNIIDNALKYSEEKPCIRLQTRNESENLVISIKDNGIGISQEHKHYIFDKFFRVTHNNLHRTKGFGIGLSYAKQTIEAFGGTISVNSDLNKGSEFIITLPDAKH